MRKEHDDRKEMQIYLKNCRQELLRIADLIIEAAMDEFEKRKRQGEVHKSKTEREKGKL